MYQAEVERIRDSMTVDQLDNPSLTCVILAGGLRGGKC